MILPFNNQVLGLLTVTFAGTKMTIACVEDLWIIPPTGGIVQEHIRDMIALAIKHNHPFVHSFNGIPLVAFPYSIAATLLEEWQKAELLWHAKQDGK